MYSKIICLAGLLMLLHCAGINKRPNSDVDRALRNHEYASARLEATDLLELEPRNHQYLYLRAKANMGLYLKNEALNDLNSAIAIKPDFTPAYKQRGRLYLMHNSIDLSISDYTKVIQQVPDDAQAYLMRGLVKEYGGDFDGAIRDYRTSQKLESDWDRSSIFLHNKIGYSYYKKNDCPSALKHFDQAISLNKNYALAYYRRGLCQMILKKYRQALNDFDSCLFRAPNFALAFRERAYAKFKLGLAQSACFDLKIFEGYGSSQPLNTYEKHCQK